MDAQRIREVVKTENYIGGMLDMSGGHIHPLNLALGEAAAVESLVASSTNRARPCASSAVPTRWYIPPKAA